MRKLKMITGISTAALTSALVLAGCGAEGEAEGEGALSEGEGAMIASEGEGEGTSVGEGEGEGESEGAERNGDPAQDDVEYLFRLGMVRGHLVAFIELYRAGEFDMAATHVKHPESELYAELTPAFLARGTSGFADELTSLATAAQSRGDVEVQYEATLDSIRANSPTEDTRNVLLSVARIVSTAAEEFEIGVNENGAITEPHEYQDAYGFLSAAREILSEVETTDIIETEAIAVAHEQIEASLASFDGLVVTETDGTASTLYGAAARIEIAALGL